MIDKFIRIFPSNEKEFKSGGLGVIQNARDVCITQNVSGDLDLDFNLDPSDEKYKLVNGENICVVEGKKFRIKTVDGDKVSGVGVYQDAAFKHIQRLPDMIGKSPYYIMRKIFEGTAVTVLSPATVNALGMEWVDDLTDFFEVSKITPIGAMKNLIETLEKYRHHSELYVDNYCIALVKQIGTDKGTRLDTAYNAKNMTVEKDTREMITRLYPYGKEDLHIGSVNGGTQYITSENYNLYQREGYEEFNEIEDPSELLTAAKWLFDESNPDRVDVPKYTVNVDYAQRKDKEISLGDIVTVVDRDNDIITKQRAIETKTYPFEPNKNSVTVGSPPKTAAEVFNGMANTSVKYQNSVNERGDIKVEFTEQLKKAHSTKVNKALADNEKANRPAAEHDYGDIWVNPDNPDQALAIVGGVLAMANGRDDNGDWKWTAFGDWTGFTADVMNAGTLNTSNVKVMSENGQTQLIDNLLTMMDKDENIRLEMGQKYDHYRFKLYDSSGGETMSVDDYGNLTLHGVLDTTKAEDGAAGYVIDGDNIAGYKYSGSEYVRQGLRVMSTADDEINLMLHLDGDIALNIHSFTEDGKRKTAFAARNTNYDPNEKETEDNPASWRAFEVTEGSERAVSKLWGNWNVRDCTFYMGTDDESNPLPTGNIVAGNLKFKVWNGLLYDVKVMPG